MKSKIEKNFDLGPGRNNILLVIDRCKTMDELKDLWKTLSPEEQKMAKPFFTAQKKRVV